MGRTISLAAVGLLAATASAFPSLNTKRQTNTTEMVSDFAQITPSKDINWVPCYESFLCMYLTVPLDYKVPEAGNTDIAFIKYVTGGNPNAPDILFNPGGPGGSGVGFLKGSGPDFTSILGTEYNFVSFDPRGVNNTSPALTCATSPEARDLYMASRLKPSAPFPEHWAQSLALGDYCTKLNANTTAKYSGTSAVVQDMMHYTELTASANGQAPEEALINYFGISYGTLLGQTLAAMYPNRLGRIILDANVYGAGYYNGFDASSIEDGDHAFNFFFSFCYEAGSELCPLAANATCAGDVETRYRALLQKLDDEPVVKKGQPTPGFVTRADLESYAYNAMYEPTVKFSILAMMAAGLEQGDTSVYDLMAKPTSTNDLLESLIMITAIDNAGRFILKNYTDYLGAITQLQENSFYGWKYYATGNTLIVNHMNILPPESQLFKGFERTNTSTPILFVGTTGDPVTPLSSAFKMSQYFEGSKVLTVDAPGHSFTGASSKCAIDVVQAYIGTGTLPEVGIICKTDLLPASYFPKSPAAPQ